MFSVLYIQKHYKNGVFIFCTSTEMGFISYLCFIFFMHSSYVPKNLLVGKWCFFFCFWALPVWKHYKNRSLEKLAAPTKNQKTHILGADCWSANLFVDYVEDNAISRNALFVSLMGIRDSKSKNASEIATKITSKSVEGTRDLVQEPQLKSQGSEFAGISNPLIPPSLLAF